MLFLRLPSRTAHPCWKYHSRGMINVSAFGDYDESVETRSELFPETAAENFSYYIFFIFNVSRRLTFSPSTRHRNTRDFRKYEILIKATRCTQRRRLPAFSLSLNENLYFKGDFLHVREKRRKKAKR